MHSMLSILSLTLILAAADGIEHGDLNAVLPSTEIRATSSRMHIPIYRTPKRAQYVDERDRVNGEMRFVRILRMQSVKKMECKTYSMLMNIGNTTMPVVIDTGSSDFWVISDACTSPVCTRAQLQPAIPFYPQSSNYPESHSNFCKDDDDGSHTGFNSTFLPASLLYGDSLTGTHAFGVIGTDSVGIGTGTTTNTNSTDNDRFVFSLPNQYFAAINDTNTSVLETQCAGILGLGFPLNRFSASGSSNPNSNLSPDGDSGTDTDDMDSQQERQGNGRRERESNYSWSSASTSPSPSPLIPAPRNVEEGSSPSSEFSPLPHLLSSFSTLGPPIWRLVTGTSSYATQTIVVLAATTRRETDRETLSLKPMFTVSLQRETNTHGYGNNIQNESTGVLTIGGLPPDMSENDLTWVEVRRYGEKEGGLPGSEAYPITWEIPIEGVYLDGVKLPDSTLFDVDSIGVTVLVDTGSSLIRGPPDVVEHINNYLRAKKTDSKKEDETQNKSSSSSQSISCSSPHILAFQIGGKMFSVDPRDFVYRDDEDDEEKSSGAGKGEEGECYPNIAPTDVPVRVEKDRSRGGGGYLYSWSLGDPFLKSVVASFYYGNTTHPSLDPPRIGLMSTVSDPASFPQSSSSSQSKLGEGEGESETRERQKNGEDGDRDGEGNGIRQGAVPGAIQRPTLPLPAVPVLVEPLG
ncbi:acid protease [Gymnopus androsaceus JB14]|uniref:Acid protease n=1 Tax=Gymnopus androsaceus JB14 TaxID=1447944 RepID=A0A6A4H3T5_9AGAR|nr:acid protease [Gymnopus androsaceus JB14]